MDNYNVPRKVNRNVMKAVRELINEAVNDITSDDIIYRAKYLMRNGVPLANVDHIIRRSLGNLTNLGLLIRNKYAHYSLPTFPTDYHKANLFKSDVSLSKPPKPKRQQPQYYNNLLKRGFPKAKKLRSVNFLNPKKCRRTGSKESLSGDDFERVRKLYRSNNKTSFKRKHTARKDKHALKMKKPKGTKRQTYAPLESSPVSLSITSRVFANERLFHMPEIYQLNANETSLISDMNQSNRISINSIQSNQFLSNDSKVIKKSDKSSQVNAFVFALEGCPICRCNPVNCLNINKMIERCDVATQTPMLHIMAAEEM